MAFVRTSSRFPWRAALALVLGAMPMGCIELDPSAAGICLIGEEGCICSELATCDAGLLCVNGTCLSPSGSGCGDGVKDGAEECDGDDLGGIECVDLGEGFHSGAPICRADCRLNTTPCGTCGDGVVSGAEQCDGTAFIGQTCVGLGFGAGFLLCDAQCGLDVSGCESCGNDRLDDEEQCDGLVPEGLTCATQGFDKGDLSCASSCTFDTSDCCSFADEGCTLCGDGVIEGAEICDGRELAGRTCTGEGFDSGSLECSQQCSAIDTSGCGICPDGVRNGDEDCDGDDLGDLTCTSPEVGQGPGLLSCRSDCAFDVSYCNLPFMWQQVGDFELVCQDSQPGQECPPKQGELHGNGFRADEYGALLDFRAFLSITGPCVLDFYVFEADAPSGPHVQVAHNTKVEMGSVSDFFEAELPEVVPIVSGKYYATAVGWDCEVEGYIEYDFSAFDPGIGQQLFFTVDDEEYMGFAPGYAPALSQAPADFVYVQGLFYAPLLP